MVEATDLGSTFANLGSTFFVSAKWLGIIFGLIIVLGGTVYWWLNKKRWNLIVEFKLPRSNGTAIYSERGKGLYSPGKGVCIIKRPGIFGKRYTIQNFSPSTYLQGTDTLTVVQIGPDNFMPLAPMSFSQVIDEKTGKEVLVMDMKADTTKNMAWAIDRKMALLDAFTIRSWLAENGQMLSLGLVLGVNIIGQFLGFGMILDRMPKPG